MQLDKLEIEIIALARYIKENNVIDLSNDPVVKNSCSVFYESFKDYFDPWVGFVDCKAEIRNNTLVVVGVCLITLSGEPDGTFYKYPDLAAVRLDSLALIWLVP